MTTVPERLARLRQEMEKAGIQALILPTSDYHDTEYVHDHFAARKHFSGFTGSAGTLVVLPDTAALWTDGRYFIQAARQLEGSNITLMKMGVEGTPSIEQYILDHLEPGQTAAFDGRTISENDFRKYRRIFQNHDIHLRPDADLLDAAWPNRPPMPQTRTFPYDLQYAGKSTAEKLTDVRKVMAEKGSKAHLTTKIDEIMWLGNFRARDIPSFPAALSYLVITEDGGTLYIDQSRLDPETRHNLETAGLEIKDYGQIYEDAKNLDMPVLVDPALANARLLESIPGELVEAENPIILMKAMKNAAELAATKNAHLKDAEAVTRFLYWLKNKADETETEVSAAQKLEAFRKDQDLFLEPSFDTISAYKDNAAMMHYHPGEREVPLKREGMLLVDSGGQYLDGTTDITRTIVLGPITEEEKYWFTKALQGHIRLEMAKFLDGCMGLNLDILARGPLWAEEMDYQCGTGHGVGHLSNVHEAPNGFRWRIVPERNDHAVLKPGMITSNEPGVYEEGKFGIRHENEMVVIPAGKNKYGQFLQFEPITFVPFDREGIDPTLLNQDELDWLNQYHQTVREKLSGRIREPEILAWLEEVTAPIQ